MPLLVALALAASTPSERPTRSPDGTPISGTMQGLISADDYPPDAAENEQEGSVVVRVTVDDKGAVSDCEVIRSSGVPSLDTQTCRIVWQRAKFTPGTDKFGRPQGGSTTSTITWRLAPDDPLPNGAWSWREVAAIGEDGNPVPCRVERDGARFDEDESPLRCRQRLQDMLMLMRAVKPGVTAFVYEQRFQVGSDVTPTLGPDDVVVALEVATLEIDVFGKVKSCQISERIGPDAAGDICSFVSKNTYVPLPGPNGKPTPFKATYVYRGYAKVARPSSGSSRKP